MPTNMPTIMQLDNVYRIYRMGQETISAVDGVSLSVGAGEILCMQGPSGSGKSTLLHMMAGLDRPSKGSIILGKTHIEKLSEDSLALFRQRHIGFIFQSYYLIPTLTAIENVTLPLMFAGVAPGKRLKIARELLDAVGLKDRMRHRPSQMSGGQQQRVSIARAFANNPKIVFADEPTGNLDTHTTYEMMNLMTKLARERNLTLIIVTHDLEISGYATRLVKIRDGRIEEIEEGPMHHAGAPPEVIRLTAEVDGTGGENGEEKTGKSGEEKAVENGEKKAGKNGADEKTSMGIEPAGVNAALQADSTGAPQPVPAGIVIADDTDAASAASAASAVEAAADKPEWTIPPAAAGEGTVSKTADTPKPQSSSDQSQHDGKPTKGAGILRFGRKKGTGK